MARLRSSGPTRGPGVRNTVVGDDRASTTPTIPVKRTLPIHLVVFAAVLVVAVVTVVLLIWGEP